MRRGLVVVVYPCGQLQSAGLELSSPASRKEILPRAVNPELEMQRHKLKQALATTVSYLTSG